MHQGLASEHLLTDTEHEPLLDRFTTISDSVGNDADVRADVFRQTRTMQYAQQGR